MKKKIIVITAIAILLSLFLYFRYIYGYEFNFYKETPKEYLNNTVVNKKNYSSDSSNIALQLQGFVKNHQESFYSKEYDESTQIMVDTIVYSPDYKKIATFIIAKNSTNKQLMPDKKYRWYYDATCYLGTKQQNSFILGWIGPNYTNSYDIESISGKIRNYYFRQKYSNTDNNRENFNLNDIRYWSKSIDWKNLENNRKMQKEFEEEKLKNPKNVYEPK